MNSLVHTPGTLRPMLRLALPVLLEQFLAMLVVFSDTALAGRYLGEAPLAAMMVLAYVMWLVPSLFALVAIVLISLAQKPVRPDAAGEAGSPSKSETAAAG